MTDKNGTISYKDAISMVEEAITDRILDIERSQWSLIKGIATEDVSGPTLDALKRVAPSLRELASSNPWHIRGVNLRNAYVFGRGVNFVGVEKPRFKSLLENPQNKSALFGVDAYSVANMASFCTGNFFVLKKVDRFIVVPIEQISNFSTNPDDPSDIWYIKRSWSTNGKDSEVWYPTATHKNDSPGKLVKDIQFGGRSEPVSPDGEFYIRRSNRQDGWTWGVPDSLGAVIWTAAYSAYLHDNAVLVKALSKIAWKLTSTTASGAQSSAVTVRDSGGSVGGVASLANGTQLQGVGVPSSQVDMGNGQPLIAAAAATFGVPVIALLSSPGESGGSYGSAQTLDEPTLKTMTGLQSSWADFYSPILEGLGAKGAHIEFPAIQTDPAYRRINSVSTAVQLGMVHRDEGREAIMAIEDIPRLHETLPTADGFNKYSDPKAATASPSDPLARQGNTGAVPGGREQSVTDHTPDTE